MADFGIEALLNLVFLNKPINMKNKIKKMNMQNFKKYLVLLLCLFISLSALKAQSDTSKQYKNVIRYNLSGALVFGIDKYIVLGYERVLKPYQSFSINFGKAALPKLVTIVSDSFTLSQDVKNTGFNVSVDYRFYLQKENKFLAPHGFYIGPYYSFNQFNRDNRWDVKNSSGATILTTSGRLNIHTIGFELGYQLFLGKHFTVDLLMVGPGLGFYTYTVKFDGNVDPDKKQQVKEALMQLLTQKFPGMNYVFSEKQLDANGHVSTATLGYRYLVQIGYAF
jgi:uncharacterized protein DUF3575